MIRSDGYVKVLDFGLAKSIRELVSGAESPTFFRSDTAPGMILGSVHYMSPEQARGLEVDPRSDVFSLGVVLYEMVLGKPPFSGPTPSDVFAAILERDPPPLRASSSRVPAELDRISRKALHKDRERRYQTMGNMVADLRALKKSLERSAPKRRSSRIIDSIAVLPLANESGDGTSDYLSDGITETVILRLSQIPRLKVMSRSAVFRYKSRDADPIGVGKELGVQAVLVGRLFHLEDALHITLELVDVKSGFQLWGERYDVDLSDILTVQDEIAGEVASKLKLKLSRADKKKLLERPTGSVEAYQDYLRGRHSWNRRTEEGLRKSIFYFEGAIAKDPSYGLAFAGLADSYAILGMAEYGALRPAETMPRARAAAKRALESEPSLAGKAGTTLAHLAGFYDWSWAEAEARFQDAIRQDADYPFSHHWYALFLAAFGRFEEAIHEERRAWELDPLAPIINKNVGTIYYYARQNDKAIEAYRQALQLDPDFVRTHYFLGLSLLAEGEWSGGVSELERAIELSGESTVFLATLGFAQGRSGDRESACQMRARLEALSRERYVPALNRALVEIGLEEKDAAFQYLETALEERSSWLVSLDVEPLFDSLRGDARFESLALRVGLRSRS